MSNLIPTTKLSEDNYIRPESTFTDKLDINDIQEQLEDYIHISLQEINDLKLGTHIKYISKKDGENKFRMGGNLITKKGYPDYLVLSNYKNRWSVQTKDTVFFRRLTTKEIRAGYQKIINEKEATITEKNKEIKQLQHQIKRLAK